MPTEAPTIAEYLIAKLHGMGVRHAFGIPGDYTLPFCEDLSKSPIEFVVSTSENCAGFAADAYARLNGLGVVCVTYCVGGLSVVNPIAGAYAEKAPVLVISGAPGLGERRPDRLLHHQVKGYETQREVFEKVTVASAALDDPLTACREIDRVLAAMKRYSRPGYLEIPRDLIRSRPAPAPNAVPEPPADPEELKEALEDVGRRLAKAKKPLLMIGVEVHRFGLQEEAVKLAERLNIPMCTSLLGKSAVADTHPLSIGVYAGAMGREAVREYVEESDLLIMLGVFMTDMNLGIFTGRLDPARCVLATSEGCQVSRHRYAHVPLDAFLTGLKSLPPRPRPRGMPADLKPKLPQYHAEPAAPITMNRLLLKVNAALEADMIVIADVGAALFGSTDMIMARRTEFLAPAYYTSMGYAVPAAIGASFAQPQGRPLVLVGDGAFQMTGMELSTAARFGFAPIVVVLNNRGYTTERFILEGPFNDITNWHFHQLPALLGAGRGFEVRTEGELDAAFDAAVADRTQFSILNVHLEKLDCSAALERLGQELGNKTKSP